MANRTGTDILNAFAVGLDPNFASVLAQQEALQQAQMMRRQDASANEWLQNFASAATPEEQALRVQQLPNVVQDSARQAHALQMADQIRARAEAPKLESFRRDADVIFAPDARTGAFAPRDEQRRLLTQFATERDIPLQKALTTYFGQDELPAGAAPKPAKPEYRQGADGRFYAIEGTRAVPVEGTPATQPKSEAPTHRTIKRGGQYVTQDWTQQKGWVDTASAPRETAGDGDSPGKKDRTEARQMYNVLYPVSFMGERVPGAPPLEEFYTKRWQTIKQLSETDPEQYQQVMDAANYLQDPQVPEPEKAAVGQRFKEFFEGMFANGDINDRFKKDKQMKGLVLGTQTPQGFEVRDGNGRVVGYYD